MPVDETFGLFFLLPSFSWLPLHFPQSLPSPAPYIWAHWCSHWLSPPLTCPHSWVKPDRHWIYLHAPSLHPRTCLWVILWAAPIFRSISQGCPTWFPPKTIVTPPPFCWRSPCAWFLLCLILGFELPLDLLILSPLGNSSPSARMGPFLTLDGSLPALWPDPIPDNNYWQFLDFSICVLLIWPEAMLIRLLEISSYTPDPWQPPLFWISMRKCQAH